MTKIKLCGLTRPCDISAANELKPEFIGFVFATKSNRYINPDKIAELKRNLLPDIKTVGVFVNETPESVAKLLNEGSIDIAQLHGGEDEDYIKRLKNLTDKPVIKAFRIETEPDTIAAESSIADHVLLDSGAGMGMVFDWKLIQNFQRPYFLAGGLNMENVGNAIKLLRPYAVDVSSGIEINGLKDKTKIMQFITAVREEKEHD